MWAESSYLVASWSERKPANVQAITTLRTGGVSRSDFAEYNLALHVGDDPQAVKVNREKLSSALALPAEPVWLDQVHSNMVLNLDRSGDVEQPATVGKTTGMQADASVTRHQGVVCAVMTADCLPLFFCNRNGTEIAIAHAGWRGLHAGIISNTVKAMRSPTDEILVSLGPAIGAQAFEVGEEVRQAFTTKSGCNESAFVASRKGHYLCDIYQLARIELQSLAITKIAGGEYCTYQQDQKFYSFRRQQRTGRMVSLIWIDRVWL